MPFSFSFLLGADAYFQHSPMMLGPVGMVPALTPVATSAEEPHKTPQEKECFLFSFEIWRRSVF